MSTDRNSPDIVVSGREIQPVDSVSHLSSDYETVSTRKDLVHTLGALGTDRLFLLPGTDIPVNGDPEVTLTAMDNLSLGRGRSQHGVQFGQLTIEGGSDTKTSELVAVKYLSPDKAAHEHLVAQLINRRLGRQATFQTLGFIKDQESDLVGIVSRYDHSVVSLDNTLYDPNSTDDSRIAAVSVAAKYLATLHGSQLRLAHGDAQPKNIAVNSEKELHFIDLESVRNVLANAHGKRVPNPKINKFMDISDFFGTSSEGTDWKPHFTEADHFIDTYVSHQTGEHSLTEDEIMELIINKIDDL